MQRSEVSPSSPSSPKRRRLVSKVWNDFNRREVDGEYRAICKHCDKDFSGSSKSGTTHLRNHLSRCSAIKKGESYKEIISSNETDDLRNQTVINGNPVFDEERSGLDMVRMIIKHGYPLDMVEHEEFKNFVKNLQPRFKLRSQDTLKADILRVYREEKEKLCKHFDMLSCRFSLILNFWTCHRKKNKYCCFTLQFIEEGHGLKLKKKILALKDVEYDYTGRALFEIVRGLLLEWNIDKKLCSITVESSSSNDQMVEILENWFGDQGYHPLKGKLFHIRCITDIVNLLVRDGLDEIDDILHKIRKAINYISETTIGKQKFQEVVKQLNLRDKDITSQGFPISWDSTFFMLQSALEFREAFSYLQSNDCHFPIKLSMEEWDMAKVMHKCLNVFYDVVCNFLGSKGLTTNVYFRKICDIHHNLLQWQKSEHTFVRSIAKKMRMTYDKYFDYCTFVSGIAAVFDPRTKLDFVLYSFKELYGSCAMKYLAIDDVLGHIFDEYAKDLSSQAFSPSFINNGNSSTSYDDNDCDILDRWYKSKRGINNVPLQRGELNQYLEEPIFDSEGEFDILGWWHTNSSNFPTLWKMARDILAIPMSTSISNSAFSTETMTINPAFNGLDSDIIEALVCGKDWLDNLITITPNKDNEHSPEPTHTSFVLAGTSLNLEPQEKHTSSSIARRKLMLSNPSSTSCTEPLPSGFVLKSSDHGSSSNDAEGVRSLIRTKEIQFNEKLEAEKVARETERRDYEAQLAANEIQFNDKLKAEKIARETERTKYEAQLAAKETQHRQDREQYAEKKNELDQLIVHLNLELDRWRLQFEANTERQRNLHVPLNYGYPVPSMALSGVASQSGASNPPGSWYDGSYHYLDTTSDISHCPVLFFDYQDQGTSTLAGMELAPLSDVRPPIPNTPIPPIPDTPIPNTPPDQIDTNFLDQNFPNTPIPPIPDTPIPSTPPDQIDPNFPLQIDQNFPL